MPYFVVIDTNVLVSALLSKHNDAATVKVFEAMFSSKIIPLYNNEIIDEYRDVLNRKKFGFSVSTVNTVIQFIVDNGLNVDRINTGEELPDSKDLVFYEVCMAKREDDSMLVTGNMRHFPLKPFIVTPNNLLEIISK